MGIRIVCERECARLCVCDCADSFCASDSRISKCQCVEVSVLDGAELACAIKCIYRPVFFTEFVVCPRLSECVIDACRAGVGGCAVISECAS